MSMVRRSALVAVGALIVLLVVSWSGAAQVSSDTKVAIENIRKEIAPLLKASPQTEAQGTALLDSVSYLLILVRDGYERWRVIGSTANMNIAFGALETSIQTLLSDTGGVIQETRAALNVSAQTAGLFFPPRRRTFPPRSSISKILAQLEKKRVACDKSFDALAVARAEVSKLAPGGTYSDIEAALVKMLKGLTGARRDCRANLNDLARLDAELAKLIGASAADQKSLGILSYGASLYAQNGQRVGSQTLANGVYFVDGRKVVVLH